MLSAGNKKYIITIAGINFLTIMVAAIAIPFDIKMSLAWITGSLGSLIFFLWLAFDVYRSLQLGVTGTKKRSTKGYFLRFLFLAVYSAAVVIFLKPNIIVFGAGLLSSQIIIYVYEFYRQFKNNKYYRGSNG